MKKTIIMGIVLVTLLVSLHGCYLDYPNRGRDGGYNRDGGYDRDERHDQNRGESHDRDRDGDYDERR